MTSASEPLIFSADVIESLPPYYQVAARYLVDNRRAITKDNSEEKTDTA